jgi:hypothetical protein
MTFMDKTKDNHKTMKDLAQLCNRPSLELKSSNDKARVSFCLKCKERKEVFIWLQNLKFPDGHTAGFRRAVNLDSGKLSGVKSHDYHIFMLQCVVNYMMHDCAVITLIIVYYVNLCLRWCYFLLFKKVKICNFC